MAVLASLSQVNASVGDTFGAMIIVEVIDGGSGRYRWQAVSSSGGADLVATPSPTQIAVESSTGADTALPLATQTNAGLLAPAFINQTPASALPATANRVGEIFVRTGATNPGMYLALDLVGNWVGPIGREPIEAKGTLTTTTLASNAGVRFRHISNSVPTSQTTLSRLLWTYTFTDAGMPNNGRIISIEWTDHADTTPVVNDAGGTPANRLAAGQITGNGQEFSFTAGPANDIVLTAAGSVDITLRAEDSGGNNNTIVL